MPRSAAAAKHAATKAKVEDVKRRSRQEARQDAHPKTHRVPAEAPRTAAAARKQLDPATLDWSSDELAAEIVRLHNEESLTMKQVTERLGLPAEMQWWRKVSLAFRAYCDAQGISRPGKRSATPVAKPTSGDRRPVSKRQPAERKISLAAMSDEEVKAAIEGRNVTYNYTAAPGQDEAYVGRVMRFSTGRREARVVTFIDHVSPPLKGEVELARTEKREPREHADGQVRSLYVDQIVAISGRKVR